MNILKKLFTMKTGFSPGAQFSIVSNEIEFILLYIKNMIYTPDWTFKELIWDKAKTVAATNQGKPKKEHSAIVMHIINKSKWYPLDF